MKRNLHDNNYCITHFLAPPFFPIKITSSRFWLAAPSQREKTSFKGSPKKTVFPFLIRLLLLQVSSRKQTSLLVLLLILRSPQQTRSCPSFEAGQGTTFIYWRSPHERDYVSLGLTDLRALIIFCLQKVCEAHRRQEGWGVGRGIFGFTGCQLLIAFSLPGSLWKASWMTEFECRMPVSSFCSLVSTGENIVSVLCGRNSGYS